MHRSCPRVFGGGGMEAYLSVQLKCKPTWKILNNWDCFNNPYPSFLAHNNGGTTSIFTNKKYSGCYQQDSKHQSQIQAAAMNTTRSFIKYRFLLHSKKKNCEWVRAEVCCGVHYSWCSLCHIWRLGCYKQKPMLWAYVRSCGIARLSLAQY